MDSNTSGSIQSSSNGEEENDSRMNSISSVFMTSTTPINSGHSSVIFNSIPNYLDPFPHPSTLNSSLNLDMPWNKSLPSPPNCSLSSIAPPISVPQPPNFNPLARPGAAPIPMPASQPSSTRASRKRPRASRRAPTTILTTDTSNFRAMVQEFTGIPESPFSVPRPRLDLFNTSSISLRSALLDPLPPTLLLRPLVHKAQPKFPVSSFPLRPSLPPPSASLPSSSSASTAFSAISLCRNDVFSNSPCTSSAPNLLSTITHQTPYTNAKTSLFTFQSLPQPSTLPSPNSREQENPQLKVGISEDFHLSHDHGRLPNPISVDDHADLRPFDWNYSNLQRVSSCKMNYTSSSPHDFQVEKGGQENGSSRGEGMVDSWICSSD